MPCALLKRRSTVFMKRNILYDLYMFIGNNCNLQQTAYPPGFKHKPSTTNINSTTQRNKTALAIVTKISTTTITSCNKGRRITHFSHKIQRTCTTAEIYTCCLCRREGIHNKFFSFSPSKVIG